MRIRNTLKRVMALFLATVLVCTAVRTTSGAGDLINLNPYRQVFRGKNLNAFGRTHRDMNIYQVGEGAGALPALCIQEGRKLPDGSPAKYEQYYVEPGKPVPVIGPFERYLPMVLAYEWLVSDNYYVPARYGVVQVYYWGCMNGYEHNWALQKQAMEKFQAVMNGDPMVMAYFEEMKAHILEGEAEYNGTGSSLLPAWAGSVQKMVLKDGHYELTLDISSCPQLQSTSWSFPDNQWSYQLAPDGRSVTFQYNGKQEPQGTIESAQIQGIENRFYAYIFTPAASENFQKQLGWLDFNRPMASVSFSVGTDAVMPGSGNLELYRHSETFESTYNIDLEKYCAETNQPLEGTVFNVWEDFDFSQVNEQGYEEGEPDGTSGQVYINCMSPEPENNYICDILTTDTDGYARHSDARYYNYSKTYCMGHPAPEWIECDHEEDEDCSCDEENDRLRGQWRAEQELCAATCDFHAPNHDEDNREQDTSAMEAMLADRDETYERFIELEYSYHLQEKTARTGYILHGKHNDDKEIENVLLSSAQAGGNARSAVYRPSSFVGKAIEPVYTYVAAMGERRSYKYPVPDGQEMELEEQRSIFSLLGEKKEKKKADVPLKETVDGGISQEQENASGSAGEQEDGDGTQGEDEGTPGNGGQGEPGNESQESEADKNGNLQAKSPVSAPPNLLKSGHGRTILFSGISSEAHTDNFKHQTQKKPEDTETQKIGIARENIDEDTDNSTDKDMQEIKDNTTDTADIRDEAERNSDKENQSRAAQGDRNGEDGVQSEIYEEYEYARKPVSPSYGAVEFEYFLEDTEKDTGEPDGEENRAVRFIRSLFSGEEDDDDSITVSLPSFMDDDLGSMDVSGYGEPDTILYTFKVWNHRTEGRLHINKRDLELYRADGDRSYGLTQGDATLEGAVYGLFAAQDIIHPDGKSGTVYNQNDLTAVAATDKQGNASFLAYTEKPGSRLDDDGNIISPENAAGPENLYNGSSITSSDQGFGTDVYPDYVSLNGEQWIGRPLIMGSYYVMELSRSEGYELSVSGISLKESNRTQDAVSRIHEAGQARISGGLSDYNSMDADGSWNDFIVESYKTENGYDITLTGYPQGAEFYEIKTETETKTYRAVLGSSLQMKVDDQGRPVYQTAKGGEYKIGTDGNPIIRSDTATGSGTEERVPCGETLPYRFRTAPYPSGTAIPADMSKWGQAIEPHYLSEQINGMLEQIGYRPVSDTSPWTKIRLSGQTNAQAAEEIMDWYTVHNFFDCGSVEDIYEMEGSFFALLRHDYSLADAAFPAVYDSVNRKLYVRKTAEVSGGLAGMVGYWIEYQKGEYSLKSAVVSVGEKREINTAIPFGSNIEAAAETVYQPLYETYREGDIVLDREGNPIPLLERVYEYEDRTETYETDKLEPVSAVYDGATGSYVIHVENSMDWSDRTEPVYTEFRVVTKEKSIDWEGEELPYSQYLTDIAGVGVSAFAAVPPLDEGSYVVFQALNYPGQNQPVQEAGTGSGPLLVLQRVIKQSVKVTKDISQSSYDGVNTYGAVHNDPLTVLLGLFKGDGSSQGAKLLSQFKFKAYLKSNLENIFVDSAGSIISEDIGTADFKGDVQKIFLPPKDGNGQRLLETKEDGSYDYTKFFDAMYAAVQVEKGKKPQEAIRQFAVDYYDIDTYKMEILAAEPGLNSDAAYEKALLRAVKEAGSYLSVFTGLDDRLAIAWDSDAGGGADNDVTTLQCNTRNGKDDFYNHSIMLAYGTCIIVEQVPADVDRELANRHFTRDYPREITLPFVPDIGRDEGTGEADVNYQTGSPYFRYDSTDTPEDLIRKYKIRFNEETHIIQANGQDGRFEIYKYGLDKDVRPGRSLTSQAPYEEEYMDGGNNAVKGYYAGYTSQSEDAGIMDGVVYDGYETADGQMEVRDQVAAMKGMQTAIDGKFASMLVPWTVLPPAVDRINPDTGNVETLIPSGTGGDFNFVAFAQEDFEDEYYNSRLRIEKLDSETGDSIIHDGALFKIYAAKRDVEKKGMSTVAGSGNVLYGEAVDWRGNPVTDADGKRILYPRVGKNNGSTDDLPVRLDKEGIPQYDESQLIRQEDQEGNETGIFRAYSTIREIVIDGQVKKVPVGYIETYKPLGAGAYVLVEIQAPEGYVKSRPVAFEVYADSVSFYREKRNTDGTTDGWEEDTAVKYQYAIPVAGSTNKVRTRTVSRIKVEDYPSRMEIHKVEDGDSLVGNQNILQKTDAQGMAETSGGFEENVTVNDAGDRLAYKVSGRKEKLEERGDVRDIVYNPETMQWDGYVTKPFDEYSEHIVEGTEKALKAMPGVKPLYLPDGTFSGRGIRFDISVSGAGLSLYHAIEIEKTGEHVYKGVSATVKDGRVTGITDTNTGTHKEIRVVGEENSPGNAMKTHKASWNVWDTVIVDNAPVNLYFYDLNQVDTREDPDTGELLVLDKKGNPLCFADSVTGMAYVYDDYGRMLAYTVDDEGNKILVKSIQVRKDENGQTIYENKTTVDDENGLPIYYTGKNVAAKDESWTTDNSMDSYGTPETSGAGHSIARLPFGAYILEEQGVPYDQGYIQARHMGLILRDTDEVQKYFMQNEFTKTAFAKLDVRTQKEVRGAVMTLYRAGLDSDGSPLKEQDGIYKKGQVYASWISGYQYGCDKIGLNQKTLI